MSLLARFGLAFALAAALVSQAPAADTAAAPSTLPGLVAFTSDDGLARLARAVGKVDFPALANQFEAQSNAAFCGPTTAAIVLNTVRGRSRDLPRDRSRLRDEDLRYVPSGFDPTLPRFTQENVITRGAKTRSQVLGEPVDRAGKQVRDFGYQLRPFDEMLRANDLVTRLVVVDDAKPEAEIRRDLVANLERAGDYVIVNYRREEVGQRGGGPSARVGACEAGSDACLGLDV